MATIFVTSDLHLNHTNIIKYCNRPFETVEEMNDTLIRNWNEAVKPGDIVFFVGDFAMGYPEKFTSVMNGNITFIRGNHDRGIKPDRMHEHFYYTYKGTNFLFIHNPDHTPKNYSGWVIHGHHHNNYPEAFPYFDPEHRKFNISVELTDYRPVPLDRIHAMIMNGHDKSIYALF